MRTNLSTLKGKTVAFVRRGGQDVAVPVTVGLFNTKSIEVLSGFETSPCLCGTEPSREG